MDLTLYTIEGKKEGSVQFQFILQGLCLVGTISFLPHNDSQLPWDSH